MTISQYPATVFMPEATRPYPSILDFLETRFPSVSREKWQERILADKVLDNQHRPISSETPYAPQEKLYYFREVETETPIPFQEEILYQDANFLVADKPHFLPTTPGGRFLEETLLHRLRERTGNSAIAPVHRIDRETAGLVLFTLNVESRSPFSLLFENRIIQKFYHAVSGRVPDGSANQWTVENRLECGPKPLVVEAKPGATNARSRITHVDTKAGRAFFHLNPHTGKKHQLRHHMASLGFPIENDKHYPILQPQTPDDYAKPLQLLAKEVRFDDPITGEPRHFVSRQELNW